MKLSKNARTVLACIILAIIVFGVWYSWYWAFQSSGHEEGILPVSVYRGIVNGQVYDQLAQTPVQNATVRIYDYGMNFIIVGQSGNDGNYTTPYPISIVGNPIVKVEKAGYFTRVSQVTLQQSFIAQGRNSTAPNQYVFAVGIVKQSTRFSVVVIAPNGSVLSGNLVTFTGPQYITLVITNYDKNTCMEDPQTGLAVQATASYIVIPDLPSISGYYQNTCYGSSSQNASPIGLARIFVPIRLIVLDVNATSTTRFSITLNQVMFQGQGPPIQGPSIWSTSFWIIVKEF